MCHPASDASPSGSSAPPRTERFEVASSGVQLPVFAALPDGASRGDVLIIHDIWGANEFYQDLARRLAGAGYAAYLPDLFVRQGNLPEPTREAAFARASQHSFPQAIADLQRVIDVLETRGGGKLGTVGFCMGGTLVMLLAAREPRVAAGVIYYGFPANPNPTDNRPLEPLQEADRVGHPLLGFWGDQDHGVGIDNVERYRAALAAAGKQHDFTIYPGLPHGFLTFDPDKPHFTESQDSWRQLLAFFGDWLT